LSTGGLPHDHSDGRLDTLPEGIALGREPVLVGQRGDDHGRGLVHSRCEHANEVPEKRRWERGKLTPEVNWQRRLRAVRCRSSQCGVLD
jgi:hypothetical protein